MAYATKQDMIDRFGEGELAQLTDRDAGASINDAVLDQALADADDHIDAALAVRYDLPLSSTPPLLKRIAATIARYFLHDDAVTETVKDQFDEVQVLLGQIANGKRSLGINSSDATTSGAAVSGPDRVFSRDTLKDF